VVILIGGVWAGTAASAALKNTSKSKLRRLILIVGLCKQLVARISQQNIIALRRKHPEFMQFRRPFTGAPHREGRQTSSAGGIWNCTAVVYAAARPASGRRRSPHKVQHSACR
jgi:hypothetical protein